MSKRSIWPWGKRNKQAHSNGAVELTGDAEQTVEARVDVNQTSASGDSSAGVSVVHDEGSGRERKEVLEYSNDDDKTGLFSRLKKNIGKNTSNDEEYKNEKSIVEDFLEEKASLNDLNNLKTEQGATLPVDYEGGGYAIEGEELAKLDIKNVNELDSKQAKEKCMDLSLEAEALARNVVDSYKPLDNNGCSLDIEVNSVARDALTYEKEVEEVVQEPKRADFFARMRKGLKKTRGVFIEGVTELFVGKKEIDSNLLEELETKLLLADVGVEATTEIINKLTKKISYRELDNGGALIKALIFELRAILKSADKPLVISEEKKPHVILVVGVNGVGKTTTIGKVARLFKKQGQEVMLAAGDTFRAAAVEQLQVWGERNSIPVIAQHTGADSASVIYDAFAAAQARGADVMIADTAGRLHNKEHLMDELKKIKRVLGKLDSSAPHEVLLVVDAGTGQNALSQAKLFHEALGLTGMVLTKLDGTAKGGVVFALSRQMQLPIRFLGVGEQIDDLRPFVASEFVDALFNCNSN